MTGWALVAHIKQALNMTDLGLLTANRYKARMEQGCIISSSPGEHESHNDNQRDNDRGQREHPPVRRARVLPARGPLSE